MIRLFPVLLFPVVLLTACDSQTDSSIAVSDNVNNTEAVITNQKPLDLKLTPEMINRLPNLQSPAKAGEVTTETVVIIDPDKIKKKSTMGLSGEVFYDETSEDYLEAIDGGKINVEIKFK